MSKFVYICLNLSIHMSKFVYIMFQRKQQLSPCSSSWITSVGSGWTTALGAPRIGASMDWPSEQIMIQKVGTTEWIPAAAPTWHSTYWLNFWMMRPTYFPSRCVWCRMENWSATRMSRRSDCKLRFSRHGKSMRLERKQPCKSYEIVRRYTHLCKLGKSHVFNKIKSHVTNSILVSKVYCLATFLKLDRLDILNDYMELARN